MKYFVSANPRQRFLSNFEKQEDRFQNEISDIACTDRKIIFFVALLS